MNWYEKLNAYFPTKEMKSKDHFDLLLEEQAEIYKKEESEHNVLMYGDFDHFIFIDYILVSRDTRGTGLGKKIMNDVKERGKMIVLEVEPVRFNDPDTQKRIRFYKREGFMESPSISYRRRCPVSNDLNEMDILYWAPTIQREETVMNSMKQVYQSIHKYKDTQLYGKSLLGVEQVLTYKTNTSHYELIKN